MSDITDNTNNPQMVTDEEPIIVNIDNKSKDILTIDLEKMTIKQLAEFERAQLVSLCLEDKLFKDMKQWQIDRLSRPKLAKLLKDNTKAKEEINETPINSDEEVKSESSFSVDSTKIQIGLVQLFEGKEPKGLDDFAGEVIKNSQYAVVSPESIAKMEKYFYYGSLAWLGYRKFFGTLDNLKAFYRGIKEKLNRKKADIPKEVKNESNNG